MRVKIGCRDVTKVLATVDGVLYFHFHDFHFQMEVEQEGYTNPADNKWIRTGCDKASDDNSSPKNPRLWGGFQTDDTLAGPSRTSNSDKERQGAEGINKDQLENSKEDVDDSEDEGLQMGDLFQPGVGGLIFGNFNRVEIGKLSYI